jgi:flavorubredoxin
LQATKLKDGIYYVGVADPSLRVFDIIMRTEFGTTYNAYLVKGQKSALIETVHNKFADRYVDMVQEVEDIKQIDYVILNHTEPDHSGSLVKILEINPDIEVYGTNAALKNMRQITNQTFHEHAVKDGEELDLGGGMVLRFLIAPNLHWPDSMFTYVESAKTLFSCDVLGAHYCEMGVTDENLLSEENYNRAFKEYYDAIVAPFHPFVVRGLLKIDGLPIDMVCNSHGPVLKKYIQKNLAKYAEWSKPIEKENKTAAIFYVSAYGYTQKMALTLKGELEKKGILADCYHIIESSQDEMVEKLHTADVVLFGSPTINRGALKPVWDLISCIDLINTKGKVYGVFGSYGWSGEACPLIAQHLSAMKLKVFEEPFTTVFNPSDETIGELEKYADRLADSVLA